MGIIIFDFQETAIDLQMEDFTGTISVIIGALQKDIQLPTETYEEEIELSCEATLDELWKKLEGNNIQHFNK